MIREIDFETSLGVYRSQQPRGLYFARSRENRGGHVPMYWVGIDTRSARKARYYGSFSEVLTWLQQRAGILGRDGLPLKAREETPGTRPIERYTSRTEQDGPIVARTCRAPERVKTSVIREWVPGTVVREITPDKGAPNHGGWGAGTLKPLPPKEPPIRTKRGRPAGSMSGEQLGTIRRDAEIIRLSEEGKSCTEIAAALGCSDKTVWRRKRVLRERKELPARKGGRGA